MKIFIVVIPLLINGLIFSSETPPIGKRKATDFIDTQPKKKSKYLQEIEAQDLLLEGVKKNSCNNVKQAIQIYKQINIPIIPHALTTAATYGNLELVKLLVEAGTDVNASADGDTPLTAAINETEKSAEIALYLINNDADINKSNQYGNPLLFAINIGHPLLALQLIELGADVNFNHPIHESSLLAQAILRKNTNPLYQDLITLLLNRGAIINFEKKYPRTITPLEASIRIGDNKLAKFFISKIPPYACNEILDKTLPTAIYSINQEISFIMLNQFKQLDEAKIFNLRAYRDRLYQNNQNQEINDRKLFEAYKIKQMLRAKQVKLLELE